MPRRDQPPAAPPARHGGARQPQPSRNLRGAPEIADGIPRLDSAYDDRLDHDASPTQFETGVTHLASDTQPVLSARDAMDALRRRAGHTFATLAAAMGKPPNTVQSRFNRPPREFYPLAFVRELAPALVGRGAPPITEAEVLSLAGIIAVPPPASYTDSPPENARITAHEALPAGIPRSVPVRHAASAAWGEMTMSAAAAVIDMIARPAALATNRAVFAVTMQDGSMAPRYEAGERLYCDPARPPALAGYALVITTASDERAGNAFVGRLDAQDAHQITLSQYAPPRQIHIARADITTLARILTTAELLS